MEEARAERNAKKGIRGAARQTLNKPAGSSGLRSKLGKDFTSGFGRRKQPTAAAGGERKGPFAFSATVRSGVGATAAAESKIGSGSGSAGGGGSGRKKTGTAKTGAKVPGAGKSIRLGGRRGPNKVKQKFQQKFK